MNPARRSLLLAGLLGPALALVASHPALGATQAAQDPAPATANDPAAQAAQDQAATAPPEAEAQKSAPEATVEVSTTLEPERSYRAESLAAVGPLGSKKVLDIPHSIVILPKALLENVQAKSVKEALRYAPLAQFQEQQGSEVLRPATRGIQGSNYQNTRQDGMTIYITGANALEAYQEIEVFSGLPAAAYGPANPAGMFNFVSKRPTEERLVQADIGYETGSILAGHVDLGGKIDDRGIFRYRVNLLDAHGTSYVTGSDLDRKLGSVGFDVHPADGTTLEFNLSSYRLVQKGYPGWFTYGEKIDLPAAPDPTRVGYGQSYAGVDLKNQALDGRWTQTLGSTWVLVVGGLAQGVERNINTPVNNITSNAGAYTSSLANGFAPFFGISSDIAYLNGTFTTGGISHDLTVGTTGFRAISKAVLNTPTPASVLLGSASISDPVVFPEPAAGLPDVVHQYLSSVAKQQGVNVSDDLGLTPHWFLKLAVSQDWMQTQNYSKTGPTTAYNRNGLSPMPSLIYKPQDNVTTYLTYASSLQQGDIAPAGTANANTALPPYRSSQWEVGGKLQLTQIVLTAAVFRLERPFAWTDPADNTYKTQGQQVNKGVELTAIGNLSDQWTIYSGATLIDSVMQSTGNALTDGKNYVGLPRFKSNVLLEYAVPPVSGLVLTGDWQYNAKRPVDDANTYWAPSYSVFSLGGRYTTRLWSKQATWRLMVDNLTDEHYWSTIGPSNITGANTGNLTAHLGAPRTYSASMSMNF